MAQIKNRMQGISTKVTASTLGLAIASLILWAIPGDEPTIVQWAFQIVGTFGAGFLMPENTPIEVTPIEEASS